MLGLSLRLLTLCQGRYRYLFILLPLAAIGIGYMAIGSFSVTPRFKVTTNGLLDTWKTKNNSDTEEEKKGQPSTMTTVQPDLTTSDPSGKKYLIWICDTSVHCFGLGDRQRAIAGVYLLAEVTNRTFGIIHTSPSNLREFYRPNIVNWDIPESELRGKSSIQIRALGPRESLHVDKIDFNAVYPQDVVYIRTNQRLGFSIRKNPLYSGKLPKWGQVNEQALSQKAWLRLMLPTGQLREALNKALSEIAKDMQEEYDVLQKLNSSRCCNIWLILDQCTDRKCLDSKNNVSCSSISCTKKIKNDCSKQQCDELKLILSRSSKADAKLEDKDNNCVKLIRALTDYNKRLNSSVCRAPDVALKPPLHVKAISKLQDFDTADLNLVCVHIRLAHTKTFPFENVQRNDPASVTAVWTFLEPYLNKGYHVYLATDSDEVRLKAKALFGRQIHMSTEQIVHIAVVQSGQDERLGLRLALMEQLMLATSCRVLVVSYSGFSMKAAQLRNELQTGPPNLFMFSNGKVGPIAPQRLL